MVAAHKLWILTACLKLKIEGWGRDSEMILNIYSSVYTHIHTYTYTQNIQQKSCNILDYVCVHRVNVCYFMYSDI